MPGCRPHLLLLLLGLAPTALAAVETARSIHDPTGQPLVWNQPGAEAVVARTGLVFGRPLDRDLALDLYPPPGAGAGERRPAVVFVAGFGDDPAAPLKSWEIYRSWLRTVAARGYVGVMGESDPRDVAGSLTALFGFLAERGDELGVDAGRLLVWACSANVRGALPFLMGASAPRGVVAAALLYGAGEAERVRADLPVLLVIAGRDGPELVAQERALAGQARTAGAPWTVVEAPGLPHAFDAFDRSPESLATVAQVLGFIDARLGTPPALAPETEERRAARVALGQLFGRDFDAAQDYYNRLADGPERADVQVWMNLAWARQGQGNQVGEMVALEQALGVTPEDWALRRRFTRLAARLGAWREVEAGLAPIAADARADAVDLGLLGLARLQLGLPAEAVAPLERAVALGAEPGSRYNLACARARTGEVDAALAALAGAIDAGFSDTKLLAEDADLEPLRADPRFAELLRRAAARSAPAGGEPHG